MRKNVSFFCFCFTCFLLMGLFAHGQKETEILSAAFKSFESDSQFKHATISLYVINSKTGEVVFDKNSQVGLAPASSLKVVTSAAAFELLGKGFQYKTAWGYNGLIEAGTLQGNLFISASGDPTLGSWRWNETKVEQVKLNLLASLKQQNIQSIKGDLIIDDYQWETGATPGGWTWEDIGNYYGAGARGLNWHENQYDLKLKPGKNVGDAVEIIGTEPKLPNSLFINELTTGKAGTGDNSVIFLPENGTLGYVRGTVPAGDKTFIVSGSIPNVSQTLANDIENAFRDHGIRLSGISKTSLFFKVNKETRPVPDKTLFQIYSPTLDSINYWFLQKSVNLFGEAFVKTIAFQKTGFGATDSGLHIIRDFWNKNGIEKSALQMIDGSGLSPANRVTTHALVTVMQFARNKNWFASFYKSLPEQNGIKMKSGYINGVRSYTGYINSVSNKDYTFSFIINNYVGSPGMVREKMWKLLDILKKF